MRTMDIVVSFAFTYDAKCNFDEIGVCDDILQ